MNIPLRHAAGSLLVVGVGGTDLTSLERAWLRLIRPGGMILFRRNIENVGQTRALLGDAGALCVKHSFACVDLEGGTVDRLRDALAPMPSAQSVARADRNQTSGISLALKHGELTGRAVRAFGFNTTLAPVLDLGLPVSAHVMGTRTASDLPAEVAHYAAAFLAGLARHGIAGCGKHFPGLGGGTLDSHQETPEIERTWGELWQEDLVPYRELRDALPMVMVNHAAYPKAAGKDLPASVSPFWIATVLRKRIGFKGLVFSDDFEMGGILNRMPIEEAAIAAIRAGMDTIEICHSPELILRAYEALLAEAERSAAFRKIVLARAAATAKRRAKLFPEPAVKPLTERQLTTLCDEILRFAVKVENLQPVSEAKTR